MSEWAAYKAGESLEASVVKVEGFEVQSFEPAPLKGSGAELPTGGQTLGSLALEDFGSPAKARSTAANAAYNKQGSDQEVDLGGPSLGYLFRPFDYGLSGAEKTEGANDKFENFEVTDPPTKQEYTYKDLDLRDENIINTLDRANKKAKEIVFDGFEQARRLSDQMLVVARIDADELEAELKVKAEEEAAAIKTKAQSQAEAIVNEANDVLSQAKERAANSDSERQILAADRLAAENKLAELEKRGLTQQAFQAELEKRSQDLANQKSGLEAKFKEESAAALAEALENGRQEGHRQGLAQGIEQGRSEVLDKATGFFKIITRIEGLWRELWQQQAPFMVTLAVEAAEAIVNKEVENGKGLAAGAFGACVDYLQKTHRAVFRVRPEDLAEIEKARVSFRDRLDGLVNIEFVADEALGPGDLVMESDAGRLDATIKNRRARIMGVLKQALAKGLTAELPPPLFESVQTQAASPAACPKTAAPQVLPKASDSAETSLEASPVEAPSGPGPEPGVLLRAASELEAASADATGVREAMTAEPLVANESQNSASEQSLNNPDESLIFESGSEPAGTGEAS
ncbi:MAG: hypothetical protein LBT47_08305 [Deltaproteobacteria bacterium]|nr:hypothetical protein [Deltaproteobacteria bacterium]